MSDARETDAELLEEARRGEPEAIERLLGRYEKSIYRFGLRMCGSEDDAKDVLQETLLAAFRGLSGFRGDAELSTWLYQVARSFCLKKRRRHTGEPASHLSLEDSAVRSAESEGSTGEVAVHAREIGEAIASALAGLPDSYREVVVLKDVEGLTADDIAKILGEDVAAVKSRIHRARMELRHSLTALLSEGAGPSPCPELAELLSAYVSKEIDQATCGLIESHLATCPNCSAACEQLQRTVSLCHKIPGDAVPESVQRALRRSIRQLAGA